MSEKFMDFTIDRDYLVKTLTDLVRINSVNPGLVPDAPGEAEIGAYIAEALRNCDVEPKIYELEPGRLNVVAILKGSAGGRSLMFNGHTDTVGVEGMTDPFSAEIRDGKLFGRGAQDMKGSIAAMLTAVKALVDASIQLKGDLIFAAVADEEYASIGTEALVKYHKADAAIVTEPSDLDVCLAHRGFYVFDFETKGRAAHGSRYEDGIDANMHTGRILAELEKLSQNLLESEKHPLLGPPSLHVPLINGGTELFIYSDRCKISVERRTLPGESHENLVKEMETIISRLGDADERFNASVKICMFRNPYEISPDAEIAQLVKDAASRVLGRTPAYTGHLGWEDTALIAEAGTETVTIGPKGAGLHSHEEWIDIQSVVDLATILAHAAINFCG